MQFDKLFTDVTGVGEAESGREKQRRVAAILNEDGHEVHPDTVKQWVMRGSLPSQWLLRLVTAADKRGRTINLLDYI